MKFCIDCKHYGKNGGFCLHPTLSDVNLVLGFTTNPKAMDERYGGRCGREGELFEPKEAAA